MIRQLCKIYGVMDFNDIEEEIIRHPAFNRLAEIKQLGYTYKGAYKGAAHTRLSHALGTSYLAKQIWKEVIRKGYEVLKQSNINSQVFPDEQELQELANLETLVGVASLLHDIMHSPFAHAIQEHLALADMLNSEANIEAKIDDFKSCNLFDQTLREQTKDVLIEARHHRLKHARLIYNLIRGDLSASCIDYVVRDHFEVGFKKPDLYFVNENNFILIRYRNQIALALDLSRNTDVLTHVEQLLLIRYRLCQQVYFHVTFTAAEAMIGKCLRHLLYLEKEKKEKHLLRDFLVRNQTDARFMHALEDHRDPVIAYIGKRLQDRQLYKNAYKLHNLPPHHDLRTMLCEDYRGEEDYSKCITLERSVAEKCGLNEKEIIVYCHNPKMFSFDIKDMLTLTPHYQIFELDNLPREEYIEVDFINDLRRLHQKLWAFYVFCGDRSPDVLQKVQTLCAEILKSKRDLRNFLAQTSILAQIGEQPNRSTKIFISYSHVDENIASAFEEALRKKKLDVFLAKTNLRAGHHWPKEIEKNLVDCEALILLWSQHAADSDWVESERTYGKQQKKKIFIVQLDATPVPPLMANIQATRHSDIITTIDDILRGLGIQESKLEG